MNHTLFGEIDRATVSMVNERNADETKRLFLIFGLYWTHSHSSITNTVRNRQAGHFGAMWFFVLNPNTPNVIKPCGQIAIQTTVPAYLVHFKMAGQISMKHNCLVTQPCTYNHININLISIIYSINYRTITHIHNTAYAHENYIYIILYDKKTTNNKTQNKLISYNITEITNTMIQYYLSTYYT